MFEHRLVPDGTIECECGTEYPMANYHKCDTLPIHSEWTAEELKALGEITKSEWKDIGKYYMAHCNFHGFERKQFSQYLSDLISLSLSGLTVEEIRELAK